MIATIIIQHISVHAQLTYWSVYEIVKIFDGD